MTEEIKTIHVPKVPKAIWGTMLIATLIALGISLTADLDFGAAAGTLLITNGIALAIGLIVDHGIRNNW